LETGSSIRSTAFPVSNHVWCRTDWRCGGIR